MQVGPGYSESRGKSWNLMGMWYKYHLGHVCFRSGRMRLHCAEFFHITGVFTIEELEGTAQSSTFGSAGLLGKQDGKCSLGCYVSKQLHFWSATANFKLAKSFLDIAECSGSGSKTHLGPHLRGHVSLHWPKEVKGWSSSSEVTIIWVK